VPLSPGRRTDRHGPTDRLHPDRRRLRPADARHGGACAPRASLAPADPHGTRLTFEAGAETERELREIVAAEARCCAFLRMDLKPGEDALILDVTGPAEAEPIIAELFA
jgi:hypothetical protein